MGILSDPSLDRRHRIGRKLIKHNRKFCLLLYAAGLIWFCCLGYHEFNHATYFSENALSPGLVYSEIKMTEAKYAQSLYEELQRERETHDTRIPYPWLLAKMKQIGLDTFSHNFTLNFPLGSGKSFRGRNVYGILRAPRIGSTEGIVLSAPYRPPNSINNEITAGVPLLLAFADFARRQNYWAKDIIFLVTDQEQLGMHAWLEAYYKEGMQDTTVLNAGSLPGRAGALQAAINLEMEDFDLEYIKVKIEGLNGQLPNLDMFNLVHRLAAKENFPSTYMPPKKTKRSEGLSLLRDKISHMLSMVFTQATCAPTGNHGLFHKYRIEALTLEGVKKASSNTQTRTVRALHFLRTIEGIFRSLNNLLERFHQSYFFYLLVANDRFVSIGDFMPCLVLMAGPLFIKAFLMWLKLDEEWNEENIQREENQLPKNSGVESEGEEGDAGHTDWQYLKVGSIIGIALLLGLLQCFLPANRTLHILLASYDLRTELIVTVIIVLIVIMAGFVPVFTKLNYWGLQLLHIGTMLYLGCTLIVVGLLNFSLGFLVAIIAAPLAIILNTKRNPKWKGFAQFYIILIHPLLVSFMIVFLLTVKSFPELTLQQLALRAVSGCMDAITLTVADSIIYGNWLYSVITLVFFPPWILLWTILFARVEDSPKKLKDQ